MKAVAVEHRKNETVVLSEDGTFKTVKGLYPIGTKVDADENSFRQKTVIRKLTPAIAAAAALMITVSGGYYYSYAAPASYVSIDVNPSIEYTLNRRHEVTGVTAMNDDASELAKTLENENIYGQNITDALERTIDILQNQEYIGMQDGDYILAGISSDSEKEKKTLEDEVTGVFSKLPEETGQDLSYCIQSTTKKEHRDAKKAGMSTGRYGMYKKDKKPGDPSEFGKKPVKEMIEHEDGKKYIKKPDKKPGKKPDRKPERKPEPDTGS
ncbi:MAG: hypothetical protein J5842_08615 [Lachnospiraceae bacterium]|nr:hypothetical protein [Lachnospiraceae bacterium]